MAQDTRTSLRLPEDLRRRIKRVRTLLEREGRGLTYSDSAIIRAALIRGLEALEQEGKRKR
jgi:hypothetical protein